MYFVRDKRFFSHITEEFTDYDLGKQIATSERP